VEGAYSTGWTGNVKLSGIWWLAFKSGITKTLPRVGSFWKKRLGPYQGGLMGSGPPPRKFFYMENFFLKNNFSFKIFPTLFRSSAFLVNHSCTIGINKKYNNLSIRTKKIFGPPLKKFLGTPIARTPLSSFELRSYFWRSNFKQVKLICQFSSCDIEK